MTPDHAILDIQNLSLDYVSSSGRMHALRNINLTVPKGKVVGIVGESGCGKSTIAAASMRLLSPNAEIVSGSIRFDREDILSLSEKEIRNLRGSDMAMVFQDPMTSLNPVFTVGNLMTDLLYRRTELSRNEKRTLAIEMLDRVGISDPALRFDQYPNEFSGGMRQRICIAMALLCNPRLLIADEPTTALDVTMAAQIMSLLKDIKNDFSGSILFISHNLGLIAEICDEVVVMYAGEVVERGTVEDIFYHSRHPYTRKLIECDPTIIPESDKQLPTIKGYVPSLQYVPEGCIYADRCHEVLPECSQVHPKETQIDGKHFFRCLLAAANDHVVEKRSPGAAVLPGTDENKPPAAPCDDHLLTVSNVNVRFRNQGVLSAFIRRVKYPYIDACLDVSLTIKPGETYGLIGESGSGKTTLGLAIMRLTEFAKGSILFDNQDIRELDQSGLTEFRRQVSMMFQDPIASLSPRKTIIDLIREPFDINDTSGVDIDSEITRLFDMVGLSHSFKSRYPHQLSGGQARRVGVARALAMSPKLVIADEPTAGLDVSIQGDVLNLMNDLQAQLGLSYLIISHNLPVVRHISDQIGIMYMGRLVEQGRKKDIFRSAAHPYTKALLEGVPQPDPSKRRDNLSIIGEIPSLSNRPPGCEFHTRCPHADELCRTTFPAPNDLSPDHTVLCHYPL
ncbi:MAG: ABC transporter ATP-binding protein [Desulfobacteraceae bacterium]|mgnify:CR=1 FL=1|nr:MAG: ABC transporter ATP-binding protein [Desulfobacteraceae bacterium]